MGRENGAKNGLSPKAKARFSLGRFIGRLSPADKTLVKRIRPPVND